MERRSSTGAIVKSTTSEYNLDSEEGINIPIINTLNSNQDRMKNS